jgi:zinc D-Ala-D-Ala dipeptidase
MRNVAFLFVLSLMCIRCGSNSSSAEPESNETQLTSKEKGSDSLSVQPGKSKDTLKQKSTVGKYLLNGKDTLLPVDAFNKNIYWELKYATTDNFMHRVLYDTLDVLYLQADVVRRLSKAQEKLTAINTDYHLLVYDGVRPLSVQWEMWNALDSIPVAQRGLFVSNPANGSVHNYGAAVDLTICNGKRVPLDMGAGYDDIRKIAYPSLEKQFLASGELTKAQVANRELLRKVMRNQRFSGIPSEWWHFNAYSRAASKSRYGVVKYELLPTK